MAAVVLAPAIAGATMSAPTGLTASAVSGTAIQLRWTDTTSNESGFQVQQSLDGSTFSLIATLAQNTTSYQATGLQSGVRYYYRVRAIGNGNNVSPYSTIASAVTLDTIAPGVPTNFVAQAVSCSQVNLSWSAVTDAGGSGLKGYNLYRNGVFVLQVLAPTTSAVQTAVVASTSYTFAVSAVDNAGNESGKTAPQTVTTPACSDTTPPSVPTGLSATPISCGQVNLAWSAATDTGGSGLKGYNVYRNGGFVKQVLVPATSTSDSGLAASTLYGYTVAAVDNAGNQSGQSVAASAATPACTDATPPSVPTGLSASIASCSQINLSWNASTDTGGSGLKGYWLYRNGVFDKVVLAPATSTFDIVSGGATYTYTVAAIDNANNLSLQSSGQIVTTPPCADTTPPSVPTGLTATAVSCSQINLAWSASNDAGSGLKGYNVYRNNIFLKQVLAPATSTSDTGLTGSSSYTYAVSAVDNAGNESARSMGYGTATPACSGTTTTTTAPPTTTTTVAATTTTTKATTTTTTVAATTTTTKASTTTTTVATTTTTTLVGPINPTLTGFVPGVGAAKDVTVVSGQAYVATADFGLAVVDVTTPGAAHATKAAMTPFWGDRVAVSGSLAVATTRNVGFQVVNLAAAGGPQVLGSLAGTMDGVAVAGQYAYLLNVVPGNPGHTDLIVVSLAVPSAPAIVGRLTVTSGSDLVVVGTLVYIVGGSGGLRVVDVSVPTSPRIVGSVALASGGAGIAVLNGYAYVADSSVVEIVNVQTPSRPVVVGSVAASAWAIAVAGTRAYVVDGMTLTILDVTSPTAPAVLSQSTAYSAQRIAAAGTTAYLASAQVNPASGQGGLYVIDASTPSTPRMLLNVYGGGDDWGIGVGGTLGIVTENVYGLRVVDTTNLAAPRVLAAMAGTYTGAAVSGSYGYVLQTIAGNPGHTDIVVLGLQTPTAPTVVGRLTLGGGSELQVVGTLAYVAAGSVGLQIVDVSTPSAPRLVSTLNTPGGAAAVAVLNGWAYVADGTAIVTVDVHTPSTPVLRGTVSTTANAIAVAGTRAYAVDGMQLKIVDVTNPAAPVLLSTTTAYGAQAIGVSGTAACLATPAVNHLDTSGGVYVLDVSSATSPRLVKQVIVPGTTRTVQAGSSLCFAGDAAAVLDVIDF